MSLLEELAKKGIITRYQIDEIVEKAQEQNVSVDKVLKDLGVNEGLLLKTKSDFYGMPAKTINPDSLSFDVLKYIPEDAALYYQVAPVGFSEGTLEIGMVDPGNVEAKNALQFIAAKNKIPFKMFVITESDFERTLEGYKGLGMEADAAVKDLDEGMMDIDQSLVERAEESVTVVPRPSDKQELAPGSETTIVEDAPVTKMVAVILRHAVEGGASDVHIENTGDKVKVRFRVDGTLYTSLLLPKDVHSAIIARVKILAKLKLDEKRKPQDGRFFAKIDNRKVDFRVSTLPTFQGEKAAIRILDPELGVKKLEATGLSQENIEIVRWALDRPYGLILITGPTGSGKTTTLYSMINEIDREKLNVVSLEDPIEYNIAGMNQSQVQPEIGYTFANGLRSILRQDPDVIMVGEIRDKETAQLAIQAALTGHLVFATLHTNNSVGVIPRLVDMGVDPFLIAPTLLLAMAQRLVRKLAPEGGKAVPMDESMKKMFEEDIKDLPEEARKRFDLSRPVFEAVASKTSSTGMQGRVAVFEMFKMDRDLEAVILKNPIETEIYDVARKKGMVTMKEDAMLKAMDGIIPFNEVNTL